MCYMYMYIAIGAHFPCRTPQTPKTTLPCSADEHLERAAHA